jgi:hypothetical protein
MYQDRWADGTVVRSGYRECGGRYELIRRAVAALPAGFRVLDVGAAEGYFALRLADEYLADVVAVEPRPSRDRGRHPRVRWVTADFTRSLGSFDVVLGLSVLHHIRGWRETLVLLVASASRLVLLETPHPHERLKVAVARKELAAIDQAIRAAGGVKIGEAPGVWDRTLQRTLYQITRAVDIPGAGR